MGLPPDGAPPLDWEKPIWHWYQRLQGHALHRIEFVKGEPRSVPYALDTSAWWPVIEREGWPHEIAMNLLDRLSDAFYGKLPPDDGEGQNDD